MTKEYSFHIDHQERDAIARADARMRGWDPSIIREKHDGAWDGCLMRAEHVLLTKQYLEQAATKTSPQTP